MTRILVVEDEPTIAVGLQDDLELEGYTVEVVEDGATAAKRALEGGHDLILLDVMLPQKDGFTVCREVRQAGLSTPIILLTAKGQEVDKVLGLELGADDYVTKPFSPRELLARIKAVLRRTNDSAKPDQIYQFGDVQVDFGRCEVSRTGRKVDLTAMEFKFLRAFLSHPGQVLTLDQLIEEVWGPDVFLTDRVIYTHINNLRSKIEANPTKPRHLITVRGIGYRFDC
jgi:DNA-binding response OmpR family regulator